MKLKLLVFFFLAFCSVSFAQYTSIINSNNPGFSESPYSVGGGVYQLESNLFFRNTSIEPTFSQPQSLGLDLSFRTSYLTDKLEFIADFSIQQDKVAFKNIFQSHYYKSGLGKALIGAKYLVYEQKYIDKSKEIRSWKKRFAFDWKRLIPNVGVYAGMHVTNGLHFDGNLSPRAGILLQNNLTSELNVITNIFYDKIGTDASEFSFLISSTYNFNLRWSMFLESQTYVNKIQNGTNFGAGFAYLYHRNFQINTSARLLFEGEATGFYTGIGVSYRIDRHLDKLKKEASEFDLLTSDENVNYKKKGFFNKILNIFKGKKKKKTKTKNEVDVEETIDETATPRRTRPKRTRKKSALSKDGGKKKKGFLGIFGGKKDKKEGDKTSKKKKKKDKKKGKKKKVETELEKLEREIKELEEELKKNKKDNN
ncbi:outer membrane putative beta-barrel porin/alpha-amylase [Lutibacter sp. Hel_I_33_5]|uniref:transporter n=1 Tax=Lutibacter sp. Hel_I_33_5 TaxID=1566289 RepID=UPI0011A5F4D5|nr:transporter [Lutibacter sp. Hel_I_33_5]TVZ55726.1 outer membrane putative beta-barrel porin/alpha-amylase [Lutibacter sp. Hel_I_33_5]